MTTTTETITAFLGRMLDEDEAAAQWIHDLGCNLAIFNTSDPNFGWECTCNRPARVLADVAARRAIVALHKPDGGGRDCHQCRGEHRDEWDSAEWPCPTLRHLAAVYSDAPGYDEAWRP